MTFAIADCDSDGHLGTFVLVHNQGSGTAAGFTVDVNGKFRTVAGLAAGAWAKVWVRDNYIVGSNHIIIDSTNAVAESNEANNTFHGNLSMLNPLPSCTLPDTGGLHIIYLPVMRHN